MVIGRSACIHRLPQEEIYRAQEYHWKNESTIPQSIAKGVYRLLEHQKCEYKLPQGETHIT